MSINFTQKQKETIKRLQHGQLKRINILYGSVRSGKTWITLVLFAMWVATMPKNGSYIMCAKTVTSLQRNSLDLLQTLVGEKYFTYSTSQKKGKLFGRTIYLEGANDARSEGKIRGMTLQGAYVDEITLIEHDFFTMLLSRLSEPGAKLFGTTNPDNPKHWLKTEFLDKQDELDIYSEKYIIEDNEFLSQEYVENLKREYTGVFYQRFIMGEFVASEGLIFDMFDKDTHVLSTLPQLESDYYISADFGIQNATVFLFWQKERDSDRWVCVREWYYSGRDNKAQKSIKELVDGLESTMPRTVDGMIIPPQQIIVDPSAAALVVELRSRGHHVRGADNDVLDGINDVSTMLYQGKLAFMPQCKNMINEFGAYAWDEKAADRGVDQPLKVSDHCCDAMRYFVKTMKLVRRSNSKQYNSIFG